MKKSEVIGKKIVAVVQKRVLTGSGATVFDLRTITLDDGSEIAFDVHMVKDDYAVRAQVFRPGKGNGR